jgi:aminoglycoside phosphotransferase (APT) family kinase protein
MSFLHGRFISNAALPGSDISASDRREMWRDAVRTLAKLHRVDFKSVGLEKFGRPSGFYSRQIKTFTSLAESQAAAKDSQTGESVGHLPHFHDFLNYFSQSHSQPQDRGVLYHGDFKIDNLVFHPTEPRVIGILDWEMATIGHPLADLTNLLQPWTISTSTPTWPRVHADEAFLPSSHPKSTASSHPGLPTKEECLAWYQSDVGFTVTEKDITWATAFALFRDSIIFQGIAARRAQGQASSAQAEKYGNERGPFAEMAWRKVEEAKAKEGRAGGAKL